MTTELRRLINLTAELYEYADQDIKQIQKELPKDEVLIIKAEHDLALSLLVRFGLADYEPVIKVLDEHAILSWIAYYVGMGYKITRFYRHRLTSMSWEEREKYNYGQKK